MQNDDSIAVVTGGKALTGTVEVAGSKHAAMHVLGAALLAAGRLVIENFPRIDDALNLLEIYRSMGVGYDLEERSAVLSVDPAMIRFAQSDLHLVPRLRSSVLMLGSLLLRTRYLRMPIPGGDRIGPGGSRGIDEFLAVLDMFGIRYVFHADCLEAWLEGDLEGDRELDLGRCDLFWFRTGNSRTALAMILAAGNRGSTVIRSALRVAEIAQLGEFLQSLGYDVSGLQTDTITIGGKGLHNAARVWKTALIPDKCEIAFWISAACLTRGKLVLALPDCGKRYTRESLGPLYRIWESILVPMNIPLGQISDREFIVDATQSQFRGIDLILDHLETEFNGRIMDACPYFIPLMCVAEGNSRYLDGKFGASRVAFGKELNKLGADICTDSGGVSSIRGGCHFHGHGVWCEAAEIRGAGALLLAMLAIEGENRLVGMNLLRRANDYVPKLQKLGCPIESVPTVDLGFLACGIDSPVRKIVSLGGRGFGLDFHGRRPLVVEGCISASELVSAALLHSGLRGVRGLPALFSRLSGHPWGTLEFLPTAENRIEVAATLADGPVIRTVLEAGGPNAAPAGIDEYMGIRIGDTVSFAGRCLSPVPFERWKTRIAEILKAPDKMWIPLTVTLGITDHCNLDCGYCFAKGWSRRDTLAGHTLLGLIDQVADAGVEAVRFVGRGESTIHADFVPALLLARARGLLTFLITNGSRLHLFPRIIAACVDSLRISVQGAEPVLAPVLDGIRQVNRLRRSTPQGKMPLMGASYVVTPDSLPKMRSVAEGLKSAGVDYILFKQQHGFEFPEAQRKGVADALDEMVATLGDDSFHVIPELFNYEAPGLEADYYQGAAGCILHHLRVVIEADGNVLTCSQKGNAGFACIGNIHEKSFLEIMNGEARREALEKRRIFKSVCPDCLFKDAHLLIRRMLAE